VNFVPVLLLGLLFLTQDGLNVSRLRAMSAEAKPQGAPS
jgi:hypothetical protein